MTAPLPWWAWLQLDELPDRRRRGALSRARLPRPDELRQAADVSAVDRAAIEAQFRGQAPSELDAPLFTTPTAQQREEERHAGYLEALQRRRRERAANLGPGVAGFVEGLETATAPFAGLAGPEQLRQAAIKARQRRELTEEGYRTPSDPSIVQAGGAAGPVGRALGAETVGESGEVLGSLVGSAPLLLASPATKPLASLAGRAAYALGGRGAVTGAARGLAAGVSEVGFGSAVGAGAEAALAGADPRTIISEATAAGLAGATSPLALIHVPGGIRRGARVRARTRELQAARAARRTDELVPGAAKLPLPRRPPSRLERGQERVLETLRAHPAEVAAGAGAVAGATQGETTEERALGALTGATLAGAGVASARALRRGAAPRASVLASGPVPPDLPARVEPPDVSRFRSRMVDAINHATFAKGTPGQWQALLRTGVSRAEVRDTGLEAFLANASPKDVLHRDQLLAIARPLEVRERRFSEVPDPEHQRLTGQYEEAASRRVGTRRALFEELQAAGRREDTYEIIDRVRDNVHEGRAPTEGILVPDATGLPEVSKWLEKYAQAVADEARLSDALERSPGGKPQYNSPDYRLPGGENYREVVVMAPPVRGTKTYSPSHFSGTKNQVGWWRGDERTIGGKRTLYVDELQSEAHQAGRAEGYYDPDAVPALSTARSDAAAAQNDVVTRIGQDVFQHLTLERPPYDPTATPTATVMLGPVRLGELKRVSQGPTIADVAWKFEGRGHISNRYALGEGSVDEAFATLKEDMGNKTDVHRVLQVIERDDAHGEAEGLVPEALSPPGVSRETMSEWAARQRARWREAKLAYEKADEALTKASEGVAPLPFAKTEEYVGLLLRRALAEAVATPGVERFAWSTARPQAARWNKALHEHVDQVRWHRDAKELALFKRGERVRLPEAEGAVDEQRLGELLGQSLSKKLLQAPVHTTSGEPTRFYELKGEDFSLGADFYRAVYDRAAPREMADLLKKLGVKDVEPHLEDFPDASTGGARTSTGVQQLARQTRGEVGDFLDQVADEVRGNDELDADALDDAITNVFDRFVDEEYTRRIDNWEPDIPDLDWFEEGARDWIQNEITEPVREALRTLKNHLQRAMPELGLGPGEGVRLTADHIREWGEENLSSRTEHDAYLVMTDRLPSDLPDGELQWWDVEKTLDAIEDELVTDQASRDRENYEPEPMDESVKDDLLEQASDEVRAIADQARGMLDELSTEGAEPGKAWVLDITPELRRAIQSGQGTYLYAGLDPTKLKDLPPELTGAALGAGVGAATGAQDDQTLRGAVAGAAVGALAGGRFSSALKSRRARVKAEAFRETPPLAQSAAAPPVAAPEPAPAVPSVRAEPFSLARRQRPVNVDDYINQAKFDTDPSGAERLATEVERVVTTTGIHPKQVVPWAETRRLAAQLGLDVSDKTIGAVNRRLTGPEMLGIRNIVSANIEALERLSRERAPLPDDSEPAHVLDRQLGAIEQQNARLLERFIRSRSQTGRDLNNLKIVANRTLDPQVWLLKAQQLAGRDLTAAEVTLISRLAEQRDRAGLARTVADLRRSTPFEKLTTLWKAGLLTNPKTHVVNVVSNTTMQALEVAKDPVAAVADRLLSLVSGERTKGGWNRAMGRASLKGAADGLREARAALRGEPTQDALAKYDLPRETNFDNAFLDTYTKTVFRLLGAEDRVFWWAAYRRSIAEQATLQGKQQGLRGVKLREYVDGMQRGEGVLADEITTQAMADAELSTFRDRTPLGDIASFASRRFGPFQFVVPFTRTPAAVATSVLRYSPAGLGKAAVWDLPRFLTAVARGKDNVGGVPLKVLQRELAEAVGRGTVGSAAIYLGWLLAADDKATGAAPSIGSQEGQQWRQENRQPNSIKVGDTWVQAGRISPVGNLIALGANLRRVWGPEAGPKTPSERYLELTAAALRTVADQPFLTGVSGALAALQEPERSAGRFAQGLAASTVPAIVGATARGLDPKARIREGAFGPIQERLPVLRERLPEQVTPLGDPVERGPTSQPAALLNALFNPLTAAPDLRAQDPLIRELADAGYAVPRLPRSKGEGATAYGQRQQLYGRTVRQALEAAIQSPEYDALREQEQAVQAQAAELASQPGWSAHPPERIQQALLEALKASSTQPVTRAEALQRLVTGLRARVTRALVAP